MGLWEAIKKRDTSYLWVSDDTSQKDRDAEAKLREMNQQERELGIIDQDTYTQMEANLAAGNIDTLLTDPNSSPTEGFKEGLAEGAENIRGAVTSVASVGLSIVPWWVYALAGLAVLIYFGPLLAPMLALRKR